VREYAKGLKMGDKTALAEGLKEKAEEFTQSGCKIYQRS
jgi:hypothetical protein